MNEHTWCSVEDVACPYWEKGYCMLANPTEDCDDYYAEVGNKE